MKYLFLHIGLRKAWYLIRKADYLFMIQIDEKYVFSNLGGKTFLNQFEIFIFQMFSGKSSMIVQKLFVFLKLEAMR